MWPKPKLAYVIFGALFGLTIGALTPADGPACAIGLVVWLGACLFYKDRYDAHRTEIKKRRPFQDD